MNSLRVFGAILLIACATEINGADIRGRLLEPTEGCGFGTISKNKNAMELYRAKGVWPWMGSILQYKSVIKGLTSKCTATLITSRHALTSANCVNDQVRSVRLGEKDYKVVRMEVHPDADWTLLKNYIAILFLEEDVEFSDQVRPACLPYTATMLRKRMPTTDVLYRLVLDGHFEISQPATYKLIKYGEVQCQDRVERSVNNTLFCAYTQDKTGRNGDPFIALIDDHYKYYSIYQIAMDVYNVEANPAKFVNIHPYIQWITATINENSGTNNEVIYPLYRANEINSH